MAQPLIDQKQFSGRLNTDDSPLVIGQADHKYALNGRFRGSGNNLRFENSPGTVLITNDNLPAGNNYCIGSFYDSLKQRIIWFNSNSNNRHGIYLYNVKTGIILPLLICFTDSQTDILGFNTNFPIPSVNIIYTTDQDGDLLCWTDRLKRPKILNIQSALDNEFGSNWLEEYLDVAKAPPSIPIQCAYENDGSALVNNLRKKLFIPKYRFVYGDNLKSVWSAWGLMPIPNDYINPQVDTDPTKNCRIGCVIQTGGSDVKKIEVAFTQQSETGESAGNVWADFFSVIVLDKAELSIPDNDVYIYRFYNNEAYVIIDPKESVLPFDYIPNIANTQELLNGNVIVYGGITEGYDPVVPIVTVGASNELPTAINTSSVLSVTQNGLSGFSTGNIHIVILGITRQQDIYSFNVDVLGTVFTITYTAVLNDTPALILAGLSTSATGQGFTQVSINANELVISRVNQVLLKSRLQGVPTTITGTFTLDHTTNNIVFSGIQYINFFKKGTLFYIAPVANAANTRLFTTKLAAVVSSTLIINVDNVPVSETTGAVTLTFVPDVNISIPAYDWGMKENLGLVYFDEKGKTDGVITSINFNATTFFSPTTNLNEILYTVPYYTLSISHRPPDWAKYYHVVRTNNLTKLKYLYFMSDRTFKDDKYGYISLESLQIYKENNPRSIIGYDFSPGDRIRFYFVFNEDSTPGSPIFDRDYEIYDHIINPQINGKVKIGQFVRIVLPTVSSFFDFGDFKSSKWYYYQIELYTPAKSAGTNLDVYNEFVQRFEIINPGTGNRCHQGMIQNQTSDLVTPATFQFDKGDAYFRNRQISVGNTLTYNIKDYAAADLLFIPDYELIKSTSIASNYTYQQTVANNSSGTSWNNPSWIIETQDIPYVFTITGIVNFRVNDNNAFTLNFLANVDSDNGVNTSTVLFSVGGAGNGESFSEVINSVQVTVPAKSRVYLVFVSPLDQVHSLDVLTAGNVTFNEPFPPFIIGCIDQNFSDFYESRVNDNGREWAVNPDEKTIKFDTLLRWGLAFQQNTNINQINRFFPLNFDEVDRAKGTIQRFAIWYRELVVVQERGIGHYGIYSKFVQSGDANLLTTTDEILNKNNIVYYKGNFGLGTQYCAFIKGKNCFYGIDPVRGYQWRLSGDGIEPISEQNKGQFFIQPKFPPYNRDYLRLNGTISRPFGAYDFFEEEAIFALPEGTLGTDKIEGFTYSWNEKRNSFCSAFDYKDFDWMASAEDKVILWKNGNLYILNNTTKYCNYFGVQYFPSLTLVFNRNVSLTQTFLALGYQANRYWIAEEIGDVITSQPNPQTGDPQESAIRDWCFDIQEGKYHAFLLRDANSEVNPLEGLNEGDELKGTYIIVKLTYKGSDEAFLYVPYIKSVISQQNV